MPSRYLIVDDHPLMCQAIRDALEKVVGPERIDAAGSLAQALTLAAEDEPLRLAVLDLGLPDATGCESLRQLRERCPHSAIVVMSADTDGSTILQCLELGANGFIPKSLAPDAVSSALQLVMSGNIYVPHQAIAAPRLGGAQGAVRLGRRVTHPRDLGLTERQADVLRLILKGLPNKLICRRLDLAEGTVKVHVSAVLRALGARNRTQAVINANELGLRAEAH